MPIRFQVDPDFYDHPKTLGMSDAATALWVRAGSYSAAKLTDGFIAEHVLPALSSQPQDAADELRRRGLWHKVKGGYRFHEWERRNLTRQRVETDRETDRNRKRAGRGGGTHSAGQNGNPQANLDIVRPESNRSPDGIQPESERIPPVSVSVSVSESVSGSGRGPGRRCVEHANDPNPPPCPRCKDAREAYEAAEAERRRRVDTAPKCRWHRGQPAHNCALCRSEQLGTGLAS